MRVLYLSHTGMTEPLGQSQVLPYLRGLARRGARIEILSFEPHGTSAAQLEGLRSELAVSDIRWVALPRSPSHGLGRKLFEAGRAVLSALLSALARRPHIVHARSYLPAAVADVVATLSPRARMVFDCRGMVGDEYVDAGHWTEDDTAYRLTKRFERRFFHRAEGLVVLTEALLRWLRAHDLLPAATEAMAIPCCVDTTRFRPDMAERTRTRQQLGLTAQLTVVYAGTLGSWYQEPEMVRFVAALRRLRPDTRLLVATRAPTDRLRTLARQHGIGDDDLLIRLVAPQAMPALLAAADLGLSFIKPCFSKMGSSPTKVAEYLGAGLPVVMNAGIGDVDDLAVERGVCEVIPGFEDAQLAAAARRALDLVARPLAERSAAAHEVACRRFSLEAIGISRYEHLYERVAA